MPLINLLLTYLFLLVFEFTCIFIQMFSYLGDPGECFKRQTSQNINCINTSLFAHDPKGTVHINYKHTYITQNSYNKSIYTMYNADHECTFIKIIWYI